MNIKKINQSILFALALLESGQRGVRQEQFYPPFGTPVNTLGLNFKTGDLRNYPSTFKTKHGVSLLNWVDPYYSLDGRSSQYHRYAIPNRKTAEQVLTLAKNWYAKATGEDLLSKEDEARLLMGFSE